MSSYRISLETKSLGKIEVEYVVYPGDGDGWYEPITPPEFELHAVYQGEEEILECLSEENYEEIEEAFWEKVKNDRDY